MCLTGHGGIATLVELWSNADTEVGPAIALSYQGVNGNNALLAEAASIIQTVSIKI